MLYFSMEPVAPKLASQGLRNDGCEGLGSCSGMVGIVPPLGLEFSLVSRSADFVAGTALCEPACADFVAGTTLL